MEINSDRMILKKNKLLNTDECKRVHEDVVSLKKYWIAERKDFWNKDTKNELFLLGLPMYQSTDNFKLYFESLKQANKILYLHFGWLYKILIEFASGYIHNSISLNPQYSYPGFHIFIYNEAKIKCGSPHFDLQHLRLADAINAKINYSDSFTIILPITLPALGSSLVVWDFHFEEIQRQYKNEDSTILKSRDSLKHEYTVGEVIIISGLYCHQINSINCVTKEESRITLQCHCTFVNNQWILYW